MKKMHGFTLVELMVAVAVIAIIASIAYPSYQEQVRKTRRSDAKASLMNAAAILERNYTQFGHYGAGTPIPGASAEQFYTLNVPTVGTPQTFTITATPVAGTDQANDRCGNLTITQAGVQGNSAGLPQNDCW